MIVADQHRRDCVGVNGHPFLQTPKAVIGGSAGSWRFAQGVS
jgi:hypothetical protein